MLSRTSLQRCPALGANSKRNLSVCSCSNQGPAPSTSQSCSLDQEALWSDLTLTRRAALQQQASALMLALTPVVQMAAPLNVYAAGGPKQLSPEAQKALNAVLDKFVIKGKAAVLLRLVFHDAGTWSVAAQDGGLNASIRFELERPENFGLKRGWKVIEQVKAALAGTPAANLSLSDLVAICGARAVSICGGPVINVLVGRVDAATAAGADPEGRLPAESLSADQLKASFAGKGFSVQEMIALSGAHTLGSKGFGDATTFDNVYYVELLKKPWLNDKDSMASMIGLPSDHVLPDDPDCLAYIKAYAADQALFFKDFATAYDKLATLGAQYA